MRSAVAARPCAPAARIARVDCMRGLLGHKFVAARTGAVSSGGCSAKRSSGRPAHSPGSIPSALACRGSRLDAIDYAVCPQPRPSENSVALATGTQSNSLAAFGNCDIIGHVQQASRGGRLP